MRICSFSGPALPPWGVACALWSHHVPKLSPAWAVRRKRGAQGIMYIFMRLLILVERDMCFSNNVLREYDLQLLAGVRFVKNYLYWAGLPSFAPQEAFKTKPGMAEATLSLQAPVGATVQISCLTSLFSSAPRCRSAGHCLPRLRVGQSSKMKSCQTGCCPLQNSALSVCTAAT